MSGNGRVSGNGREPIEGDALRTDRYLDALLSGPAPRPADTPDAALDPVVRDAVARLAHDLFRVHPSFRFEERLAARLAETARALSLPAAAGAGGGALVPISPFGGVDPSLDPDLLDDPEDQRALSAQVPREVLIGGAITSAALSVAALLAWRRARPARSPMARAVRAVRVARLGQPGRVAAPWRRGT